MKIQINTNHRVCVFLFRTTLTLAFLATTFSCKEDFLTEQPLDFANADVLLVNKAGFEAYIISLHAAARDETFLSDDSQQSLMNNATDAYIQAGRATNLLDYNVTLNANAGFVNYFWEWAYLKMLPRANTIITYAERPTVAWSSEAEKNAVVAEARFFRAYAYHMLGLIYGDVPIVDELLLSPKYDFTRAPRRDVFELVVRDLEFAAQWLPETTPHPGRVVRAAANHFLAEAYMIVGENEKAIAAATKVIDNPRYALMRARFGSKINEPGDVFSDLFRDNNQNLAANTETIWAIQFEFQTQGGIASAGHGNNLMREWGPAYYNQPGMIVADSMGRGAGRIMFSNYYAYDVWTSTDWKDMRNSRFNIRRGWTYNDPNHRLFGQVVDPIRDNIDTVYSARYYPYSRKLEGDPLAGEVYGRTFVDFYKMRLAETYLLRAEAHLRNGNPALAAQDINVVRQRAKAIPATAAEMTLDYILDERARELVMEEHRRKTLHRFGYIVNQPVLAQRIRKYNYKTGNAIQDFHVLWPIPQKFIDANSGNVITQNPGYN
ncbi:hypothetical protein GCM10027275_35070 [Rhabdobacter roseus]|uniref:RagB/SusD family nutrient uptake outer membrane protein n=1 Tax=Rhabdobacter roseus TaxID=1655419 RepID=A0A840TUM6_9BACT|nr:RagB/SusD family nutrient uptake outer membrane protein [Rhabdobacter roseus]MBB5285272.1 hypothetical protein [Rhabdobacter roseus]